MLILNVGLCIGQIHTHDISERHLIHVHQLLIYILQVLILLVDLSVPLLVLSGP